ncbi:uncharacterized protein LOC112055460 [Bicyclus anynana]|uniref:Uncharacterized protein LOC112055460 n=1 Tax=Bicyclus anynana TaxID=110368 RepID=A0A6J1P0S4_BICAN|nr:uncharacterized protein LOC112055460 [Bicyclus anynana]
MKPCYRYITCLNTVILVCAIVANKIPDMTDTNKTELRPLLISAGLGDIIFISAPIVNNTDIYYYLSNPNGDSTKLNINISRVIIDHYMGQSRNYAYLCNNMTVYYDGVMRTIMATTIKRKIINFNYENQCHDSYDYYKHNDFSIGPLGEDDHGNWVLSAYYENDDGDWNELFQVITIEIVEPLATYTAKVKLIPGQTFKPRFLYPINYLESCEINAPRTTFDRFYDRDTLHMDSCGFRIPNVTKNDQGHWNILGVGKIVYTGNVYLNIDDKDL